MILPKKTFYSLLLDKLTLPSTLGSIFQLV